MAEEKTQPKIIDVTAPAITKHTTGMAGDAAEESQGSTTPTTGEVSESAKLVSNVATTVKPLGNAAESENNKTEEQPAAQPQADAAPDDSPAEAPTPDRPTSPYEASDSLPDMSQKMTTAATDEMQSPHIYDTKEYIVPIKDTMHSHGTFGKIMAGIISAAVVTALVLAVAYYFV